MRTKEEIEKLLDELCDHTADDLEDQDLDFKRWDGQTRERAVAKVIEMAVCMANGGGGTVVFGVSDRVRGREHAITGVPPEIDINRLMKDVYDRTDPKLTPVFEEIIVPEGTGRLLVMQVNGGLPPYTDTAGTGKVRIGKECQPLTGTLRRRISIETGETDFTAETVEGQPETLLSAAAMDVLRTVARRERAPEDLLRLSDTELFESLGLTKDRRLTRAALLLGGSEEALRRHVPGYAWTYLRLESDEDYSNREDRTSTLPVAVMRIEELLLPHNPITTEEVGLFHFEHRTFPAGALREGLLNAFAHTDYRIGWPIMVKHYPDRLEMSNPGGFIGGITSQNILHHRPMPRNPRLVEAMLKLRLVNRSNLGVSRMFADFLREGKEPPRINEVGESVEVKMKVQAFAPAFRAFVAEQADQGRNLMVDELLVLHYLLHHAEAETTTLTERCQRRESEMRDRLSHMEGKAWIERGGTGRGTYWILVPALYDQLAGPGHPRRNRRIDWEAAKTRILSVLIARARRGEKGLSNQQIRRITYFDRHQIYRMMKELRETHAQITYEGHGAGACYGWRR